MSEMQRQTPHGLTMYNIYFSKMKDRSVKQVVLEMGIIGKGEDIGKGE
jgi:hypothetical protein